MARKQPTYRFAVIATDVVILTVRQGVLNVLLIQMKKPPFRGHWAMPGGLIKGNEGLETAAMRNLLVKTGVRDVYLEQLCTFGDVGRDPFGRVVSVAYFALIPSEGVALATTDEYAAVRWFPVDRHPKLAYDHETILKTAVERLRAKLGYTNIVCNLMPRAFTLTDLQKTYESILQRSFDKRNFRKKLLGLALVEPTDKKQEGQANRPATLYRFRHTKPTNIEML